ncbi:MAG: hypothetical protein AAB699_00445 [Patescibacteria group bacterium]
MVTVQQRRAVEPFLITRSDLVDFILASEKIEGDSMDGILVSWLTATKVLFDKSGLTTKAVRHAPQGVFTVKEKARVLGITWPYELR